MIQTVAKSGSCLRQRIFAGSAKKRSTSKRFARFVIPSRGTTVRVRAAAPATLIFLPAEIRAVQGWMLPPCRPKA